VTSVVKNSARRLGSHSLGIRVPYVYHAPIWTIFFFLPSGNVALTRRARKHSTLSAVVLKWSHTRKRYERQGLLVEAQALEKAEEECLADEDIRERRREREATRREELDRRYVDQFAARVRELFPGCPAGRERAIAEHACLKYSGRVGTVCLCQSVR